MIHRNNIRIDLPSETINAELMMGFVKGKVSIELVVKRWGQIAVLEKWEGTAQEFHDKVLQPFFENLMVEKDLENDRQKFRDMGMNEEQVKEAMKTFEWCPDHNEVADIMEFGY